MSAMMMFSAGPGRRACRRRSTASAARSARRRRAVAEADTEGPAQGSAQGLPEGSAQGSAEGFAEGSAQGPAKDPPKELPKDRPRSGRRIRPRIGQRIRRRTGRRIARRIHQGVAKDPGFEPGKHSRGPATQERLRSAEVVHGAACRLPVPPAADRSCWRWRQLPFVLATGAGAGGGTRGDLGARQCLPPAPEPVHATRMPRGNSTRLGSRRGRKRRPPISAIIAGS